MEAIIGFCLLLVVAHVVVLAFVLAYDHVKSAWGRLN